MFERFFNGSKEKSEEEKKADAQKDLDKFKTLLEKGKIEKAFKVVDKMQEKSDEEIAEIERKGQEELAKVKAEIAMEEAQRKQKELLEKIRDRKF